MLVVDDEEGVRAIAVRALTDSGFRVLEAADGIAGIELFIAHADTIAAVLLDFSLPHLMGDQVFREFQRIKPGIPVVLMSGYAEYDSAALICNPALVSFVQKPFTMRELQYAMLAAVQRPTDRDSDTSNNL